MSDGIIDVMLTRRSLLLAPFAVPLARASSAQSAASGKMLLSIHQNTSRAAGYRGSLEGWAKAGIRYVELSDRLLEGFLENDTLPAARRVLSDLGLTPVSAAVVLPDIWIPGPARTTSLDRWRRGCEQFANLGLQKVYSPSITNRPVDADDFAATPDAIREAGEIASEYELTAMIEFTRTSTHLATLTSSLQVIRAAAHPNVRPMIDFFHFWSGLSKFDDLDLLEPGELAHTHFQDLLDTPRELINNDSRLIPGDGIAPVVRIISKLVEKQYDGALSVELFRAELVQGDPFEVGTEIREKCEAVMREAQVL
uniref:Sugar phosphate isomerases/epimerases n=1 Tax=uncultured Gemmatimonadales bacterium HF0770_11C06 TaxID=723616 RepID=E7C6Y1_9BACT|nr:sugar phosphate isomerases/epimerases [uncultured Gemmatimonadales bacterium HF0770_11C06]